jgi:magnesium-transporting ATPase (P-type)
VVQFVRYVILLNQMIPISLYVTLELVKVAQCVILTYDEKMRHTPSGGGPAFWFKVKTTTLNEELGQVCQK